MTDKLCPTCKLLVAENQGLRQEVKTLDNRLAGQRRREGQSVEDRLREIKRDEMWTLDAPKGKTHD